jgi:hypothetical protein
MMLVVHGMLQKQKHACTLQVATAACRQAAGVGLCRMQRHSSVHAGRAPALPS